MSELPTEDQINALMAMQLREAQRAYRARRQADIQLTRLAKYAKLTPAMKTDRGYWLKQHADAQTTLDRILGVV